MRKNDSYNYRLQQKKPLNISDLKIKLNKNTFFRPDEHSSERYPTAADS